MFQTTRRGSQSAWGRGSPAIVCDQPDVRLSVRERRVPLRMVRLKGGPYCDGRT